MPGRNSGRRRRRRRRRRTNPWIQRRKKFRNVNLRALKVAGRIFLGVFVKDVQSCQVKWDVLSKPMKGLLLYTIYF